MTTLKGAKILIIDDDPFALRLLEHSFAHAGAEPIVAASGNDGMRLLFAHHPDLVILDIMMPDRSGWELCANIRQLTRTPIIMLTSLSEEDVIVRALDAGAADFVSKPFRPRVLLARARAAMREATPRHSQPAPVSDYRDRYLKVDLTRHRVAIEGEPVKLTKTEFRLLELLVRHSGQVLTFEQILQHVWGLGYEDSVGYVHSYISRLRRKLERDPRRPRYLISEHGVGYRFRPQQ